MVARQVALSMESAAKEARTAANVSGSTRNVPFARRSSIQQRMACASRPVSSNSCRSRFDDTSMSMDGLGVSTKGRSAMS